MNIGQAATASGLPAKTIRYYESVGLITEPSRAANGYREYSDFDVEVLHFIQRARATGFSLAETRQLLSLYLQPQRHSKEVKALVEGKVAQLDEQLKQMQSMRNTLLALAKTCPGDESSQCTILSHLADKAEVDNE
jgi:MerR family copper efflux transcriptional regulator